MGKIKEIEITVKVYADVVAKDFPDAPVYALKHVEEELASDIVDSINKHAMVENGSGVLQWTLLGVNANVYD
ncbi:hypothetical protein SEA_ARGAN_41 [Arthrobacter phage Argan]|nr:hypothetical protein SEA_ARGAN_41 [Arthrobacter phage Argan]